MSVQIFCDTFLRPERAALRKALWNLSFFHYHPFTLVFCNANYAAWEFMTLAFQFSLSFCSAWENKTDKPDCYIVITGLGTQAKIFALLFEWIDRERFSTPTSRYLASMSSKKLRRSSTRHRSSRRQKCNLDFCLLYLIYYSSPLILSFALVLSLVPLVACHTWVSIVQLRGVEILHFFLPICFYCDDENECYQQWHDCYLNWSFCSLQSLSLHPTTSYIQTSGAVCVS